MLYRPDVRMKSDKGLGMCNAFSIESETRKFPTRIELQLLRLRNCLLVEDLVLEEVFLVRMVVHHRDRLEITEDQDQRQYSECSGVAHANASSSTSSTIIEIPLFLREFRFYLLLEIQTRNSSSSLLHACLRNTIEKCSQKTLRASRNEFLASERGERTRAFVQSKFTGEQSICGKPGICGLLVVRKGEKGVSCIWIVRLECFQMSFRQQRKKSRNDQPALIGDYVFLYRGDVATPSSRITDISLGREIVLKLYPHCQNISRSKIEDFPFSRSQCFLRALFDQRPWI